jgi:hypothetical protein
MFTPRTYAIGDRVKLTIDMSNQEGTFGAGHEFTIIDFYEKHGGVVYDLRDHEHHLLGEVPVADIAWATDSDA